MTKEVMLDAGCRTDKTPRRLLVGRLLGDGWGMLGIYILRETW
jgi:hypothetical protein